MNMADLCLGTVQFGMKYGINNTLGQPSLEDSFSMLDAAIESGVGVIDTARAYGQAEEILGKYFKARKWNDKIKVISKFPPNCLEERGRKTLQTVEDELLRSLRLLNMEQLDGYLLHTPEYIYRRDVLDALLRLKEKKLVSNIGVSIYDMAEGMAAIETGIVDYVQLPYSVLDQRAAKTGFIKKAKKAGIKIYARSAFLQGLFMMNYKDIPPHLNDAIPYLNLFDKLIKKYNINRIDALIHFVTDEPEIDYLVLGVDTKEQLLQDIESFKKHAVPKEFLTELKLQIGEVDKSIIFPSLWSDGKKAAVNNSDYNE